MYEICDCNVIGLLMKEKISEKLVDIIMQDYEIIDKTATQNATFVKMLMPKQWKGKRRGAAP